MSAKRDSLGIHTVWCTLPTVLVLVLALLGSGCGRHWAGRPERPAYLLDVHDYDSKDHFKALEEAYETAGAAAQDKRDARDKYVRHGRRVMDSKYAKFLDDLIYDRKGFDSSADILAIGLDTASALFQPVTTKSILAGASAVTTGSKVTIDKTYFYDQTLPVLVHQMEADRQAVLADIMAGLDKPTNGYSLDEALRDLGRYYHAGTIDGALVAIQRQAAERQREAEVKLNAIKSNNDPLALQLRGSIQMWLYDDTVGQNVRNDRLQQLERYVAATFPIARSTDALVWMQGATASELTMILGSLKIPKKTQDEIDAFYQKDTAEAAKVEKELAAREQAALAEMNKGAKEWDAAREAVKTWFAAQDPNAQGTCGDVFYDAATLSGIDFSKAPFDNKFVLRGQERIDPKQLNDFIDALKAGDKKYKEMLARVISMLGIPYPTQ